jgi:hypothetical protein
LGRGEAVEVPFISLVRERLKEWSAAADSLGNMIISDEQVRRAVEYLRTPNGHTGRHQGRAAVAEGLLRRISEELDRLPDVREDRIREAQERCMACPPDATLVAEKLIGRVLSDAIR